MKSKTKLLLLLGMVTIAALMLTGTAFAEGEEPPPEPATGDAVDVQETLPPESVESQPAEESPPAEDAVIEPPAEELTVEPPPEILPEIDVPAEEPLPTEEIPVQEIQTEESLAVEPDPVPAPADENLADDLVLVDEAGQTLELDPQEAVEAAGSCALADPYFTNGGNKYCFVANGICDATCNFCNGTAGVTGTPAANPIQAAIDYIYLNGTAPDSGQIYIEKAIYAGPVVIDQSLANLNTLSKIIGIPDGLGVNPKINGSLTISNLVATFSVVSIDTTSGIIIKDSSFTGEIIVDDSTSPLTLSNVEVNNLADYGILISNHKGNVTFTNVKSSDNFSFGARIENSAGGNVTVTNSAFDRNSGGINDNGLSIKSNGTVTINGLSASYNGEVGLFMESFASLSLKNAILTDNIYHGAYINTTRAAPVLMENVIASNNGSYGLDITTAGAVTLRTVDTQSNHTYGISINTISGTGAVSLTGIRTGGTIGGSGLYVNSRGAITITSITSDNNSGHGAYLDNSTGAGNVTITSPAAAGLAGTNAFFKNGGSGLYALSKGSVILTNLDVYDNSNNGVEIHNTYGTGGVIINKNLTGWSNGFWNNTYNGIMVDTKGSVSISDSYSSQSGQHGVCITGAGAITLVNVEAYENGWTGLYDGVYIDNTNGTGGVTIRSTVLTNLMDFGRNSGYGIRIYSNGAISAASVECNDNLGFTGLYIENYTHATLAPAVTISYGNFNNNNWAGLDVKSKGAITLTNVSASDNHTGSPGVSLDNTFGTASPVTIRSTISTVFYEFSRNPFNGIHIQSKGAISVSNVIAEQNGADGIQAQNNTAAGDYPVSISNGWFNDNGQNGLKVISRGAVTFTNVGASDNGTGYYGATISNWAGTALTGVTIRSTLAASYYEFSRNDLDGIYIWTEGPVSVSNVVACENGNQGLWIKRMTGSGAISITRASFNHNGYHGLLIEATPCAITLLDVTASDNDPDPLGSSYSGARINATYGSPGGSVTVRASRAADRYAFSNNTNYGLYITSSGSVAVSNVVAETNTWHNIYINNSYASDTAPRPVSLAFCSANGSVNGYGIYIETKGSTTMNTLAANGNGGIGLYVDAESASCLAPAHVTLTGSGSEFNSNHSYGVRIETEGNISLTNLSAEGTIGGDGISLNNNYIGSVGNVTISASGTTWNSSSGNADDGLAISTKGIVTITRLHSSYNGGDGGVIVNSHSDPLIKNATLTACEFNWNRGDYGLNIQSKGAVTLASTHADSNEGHGIHIETDGAMTFNGVTAMYNSKHSETIPYTNATIYERLTSDVEGDIWYFTAAAISNTITLESADFDAYLKLYHWNTGTNAWDMIDKDDSSYSGGSGIDDAQITGNLTIGDNYYILATTYDQWGQPGEYILGFNGPGTAIAKEECYGAEIRNDSGTGNVTITSPSTFWSDFSENNFIGLSIATDGAVTITNTSASSNGGTGMEILAYPTHVTIRNTSTRSMQFSNNLWHGINLPDAYGNITLSGRIFLNNNGMYGAKLENAHAPSATPMSVTLSGVTANGNKHGDGLHITSIGQVTLSNITVCNNAVVNAGVYVSNAWVSMRNLTINGTNLISNNTGGSGLEASSSGIVSISGVRAEGNDLLGIYINDNGVGKTVTLSNIISQYNKGNGLYVVAKGKVTFTNVRSNLNGSATDGDGIYVNADNANPIYFNYCTVIGNVGSGIYADSASSWLHLLGTSYFGNDTDQSGDLDFFHNP